MVDFASGPDRGAARFSLGRVLATRAAIAEIPPNEILAALKRHERGDWGELTPEDAAANDQALTLGLRILSAYRSKTGTKFWIITEADRTLTTVLLPSDY